MRPKRALCGRIDAHDSHYVMPQDYRCPGLGVRTAATGNLLLLLEQHVRDHYGKPPTGTTLIMHPSVYRAVRTDLDFDYTEFIQGKDAQPVPEIPLIVTTALETDEWRLVVIDLVVRGVLPTEDLDHA